MPFYRIGDPGEDIVAHVNLGGRKAPRQCAMPCDDKDNPDNGLFCGRMSTALCDAPGCDKPICELHRTKHAKKSNTDFCPDHKQMAAGK